MYSGFNFKKSSNGSVQLKAAIESAKDNDGFVNVPPFQIDIEPTKRCNLGCLFCSRNYWDDDLNPQIDFNMNIMDQIEPLYKYCSVSALQGLGEPLLYDKFFDLLDITKKYNIFSMISTNCTTLNEENIHKIVSGGLDHITLSIDGRKSLPELRGIHFEKIAKKIKKLCAQKKNNNSKTPNLYIEVVLSLINLDDLTDIIHFASVVNIDTILVYHPEIYEKSLLKYSFYNDLNRTKTVFDEISKLAVEYNVKIHLPNLDEKNNGTFTSGDNKENMTYCDYPFQYLMVNNEGKVSPCCIGCVEDKNSQIIIGDLEKNDLLSIWNGKKMRELRMNMLMKKPSGLCKKCPMKGYSPETYVRYLNQPRYQDKDAWT